MPFGVCYMQHHVCIQSFLETHMIMLFWAFLCGKSFHCEAVKIVLFELWWHHILPDAILFYKHWHLHVATFLLRLFVFCMHIWLKNFLYDDTIRAHSRQKKTNIEFSALFDVKIKLQHWKFNKLPSTRHTETLLKTFSLSFWCVNNKQPTYEGINIKR